MSHHAHAHGHSHGLVDTSIKRSRAGLAAAERWAGLAVVFAIFVSACVAGYESILRLIDPREPEYLLALAIAGLAGFAGNWIAAGIRTRPPSSRSASTSPTRSSASRSPSSSSASPGARGSRCALLPVRAMAKGKKKRRPQGHPARKPAAPTPAARSAEARPALSRRAIAIGVAVLLLAGIAAVVLAGGGDSPEEEASVDPQTLAVPWVNPDGVSPIVGSVDVNPADDSVWFSTNTGIWRVAAEGGEPEQVTGTLSTDQGEGEISEQLVVRFRGPDRLIGSGHPPPDSDLPATLGMIESDDGGATWSEISGLGETDYHAIQVSGSDTIVAGVFEAAAVSLSRDGGKTFEERRTPDPLVDLEADPEDAERLIASTQQAVISSSDGGESWRERDRIPNVRFTWPEPDALYRIDPGGSVKFSADGGATWQDRGDTGGEPQAMFASSADHLVVALIDGTVKESDDGGRTWTDLVTPPA
ncbi:MAG TPA: hypothetical protein VNO82_13435 [Solirubrobacteraceae bacterium]|nr:hypothetical protein [Solirubrobacteraceae bacterium]